MGASVIDGWTFAATVAALVPATLCLLAGLHHLAAPAVLGDALRQPPPLRRRVAAGPARRVARGWGVVEVLTGGGVVAALLTPAAPFVRMSLLLWLTAVYLGFLVWLAVLRQFVPGAHCGCGSTREPADGIALARALLLAALPILATAGAQPASPGALYQAGLMVVAGGFAVPLWLLPRVMRLSGEPA